MGGAGKTRLALEAASRQVGAWPGGVWLVDLMPLSDPGHVPGAVARTLGVADRPDVNPLVALVDHLRTMELLLVIDNCEHLAEACGELTHEILRGCAERSSARHEPRRTRHSGRARLCPRAAGDAGGGRAGRRGRAVPRPSGSSSSAAARPVATLRVGRDELPTVATICRELDGLPLAIELAAARARMLSIDEIAARLADRFRFLRSWRRVADPRHQTLRTTIDWSYELLADEERELLARLSVFAGGFTLEAVAAVCVGGDDVRAVEQVGRLVEFSLVVPEDRQGVTRYRLLETIREYAAERLDDSGAAGERPAAGTQSTTSSSRGRRVPTTSGSPAEAAEGGACGPRRRARQPARRSAVGARRGAGPGSAARGRAAPLLGHSRATCVRASTGSTRPSRRRHPASRRVRAAGLAGAALLARLAGDFARAQRFAEEGIAVGRASGITASRSSRV